MKVKNTMRIFGCLLIITMIPVVLYAAGGDKKPTCISQERIMKLIEEIPKSFPFAEKDNVYIIDKNTNGVLSVTIDGLRVRFFNSRENDPIKWFSVSNVYSKNGLDENLGNIGCVVAGVNYYETGKVDDSSNAKNRAQTLYNKFVAFTENRLKK